MRNSVVAAGALWQSWRREALARVWRLTHCSAGLCSGLCIQAAAAAAELRCVARLWCYHWAEVLTQAQQQNWLCWWGEQPNPRVSAEPGLQHLHNHAVRCCSHTATATWQGECDCWLLS
jgi:hypothetical protein